MRKLMHTGTAVILGIAVIVGGLGSMQMIYAAKTAKLKDEGVKTAVSIAKSKINKTMPTVELEVETETVQPEIILTAAQGENEGGDEGAVAGISYDKLAMANVMEAVNIREEPSEDSRIIGKLYKECGGEILERLDGWTKLKTGSVTGYVSNEYLLFGEEAKELARSAVDMIATSNTSCLRVRTEPNEEATVLGLLAVGDKITAVEKLGDWIKAEYSDGTECYVASRYVDILEELPYGESMEDITKREEETRALKEAASKEMASASKDGGAAEGSAQASNKSPAPALDPSNIDDVRLLAALIQCEGGNEVHEGQVAIGDVVMNRLRTGRYGSSIYSVIYAKAQFGPAGSGKVAQVYLNGPSASCLQAASEAISGVSYIGNATSFRSINSGHVGMVVGNHVFW